MSRSGLTTRIEKELRLLQKEPNPGTSIDTSNENKRHIHIMLVGSDGTPYAKGIFKLELFLPAEYPMDPPKIRFLTKIYHPNIDRLGHLSRYSKGQMVTSSSDSNSVVVHSGFNVCSKSG